MAEFQCRTEVPAVSNLIEGEITVGRKFIIHCEGPFPAGVQPESVQLVLPPAHKYDLKLFSFEYRSTTSADLLVTTYRAGALDVPLSLQLGEQTLALGNLKFEVKSVLPPPTPETQQQPPQPYPPFGPFNLPIPPLYWGLLAVFILTLGLTVFFRVLRHLQRKSMIERLKQYDSALSPVNQFYHSLRQLQRSNTVFAGVKASEAEVAEAARSLISIWQLYLTREFQVPASKWNEALILKNIKKYHRRIFAELSADFKKVFKEVKALGATGAKFDETDVQNFAKQIRLLIEKVEKLK